MQAVKSKDSKIELILSKALRTEGIKYNKNVKTVFGKPDFVIRNCKLAVFCDSEFWHGKNWDTKKKEHKSNKKFWFAKIEKNIERDKKVTKELKKQGWIVLRFWGNDIQKNTEKCMTAIMKIIHNNKIKINEISKHKKSKILLKKVLNTTPKYSKKNNSKINYVLENPADYNYINKLFDVPFPEPKTVKFTFIDLFAGIGGFRIALQNLGGKCLFSSEWDEQAQKTYYANFGEMPFGDITKESTKQHIPDKFDILCAGFPCQAFSLAGKRLGFEEARGTLFFDVAEIIKRKQPKAFFLENVKGLKIHNKGQTLKTILKILREDLNYFVPEPEIINAKNFGVPQNRERIYIVGFRKDLNIFDFKYPKATDTSKTFADIKEIEVVSAKYYLSTQYQKTLIEHKQRHANKGNGFGYEIIPDNAVANAIVVGGMGRERNLVIDQRLKNFTPVTKIKGEVNRDGWRRMTPREWARLQGFEDKFKIVVSDASAYKQFGNCVAIPAIQETAKQLLKTLNLNGDINERKKRQ